MISLLSRCQSSVSSAKLVLFSFHPSSSHKAFHKEAHIALRLDGSTITHSLTEHSAAWRAVPSHTASQSTHMPGWQYYHTQPHRALCCQEDSTITHSLTEHSAWMAVPSHTQPHRALCCLEGSTMSNLVHRRRRCARIVLYTILCLEGSTPEDRCLSRFLSYGCSNTNPLNSFHPY